jgi:hypothetical protein
MGMKTSGTGVLEARDSSIAPSQQINLECAGSLYSIGRTAYAGRPDGPKRIQIRVRDLDADKMREYLCIY